MCEREREIISLPLRLLTVSRCYHQPGILAADSCLQLLLQQWFDYVGSIIAATIKSTENPRVE